MERKGKGVGLLREKKANGMDVLRSIRWNKDEEKGSLFMPGKETGNGSNMAVLISVSLKLAW